MPINKIIDPNVAANAYANSSNIAKNSGIDSGEGVKFSDFLEDKVSDTLETMKQSEKMSARAVTGEADLTEVVQAVTEAELTLQTVVAVRDRVISAYQEIMRMPI